MKRLDTKPIEKERCLVLPDVTTESYSVHRILDQEPQKMVANSSIYDGTIMDLKKIIGNQRNTYRIQKYFNIYNNKNYHFHLTST